MNLRGFWNKNGPALVRRTQFKGSQLKVPPLAPAAPENTWRDHPDQEAVKRALVAKCPLQEVKR